MGLPDGGPTDPSRLPIGVLGAVSASAGTRFDRILIEFLLPGGGGGEPLRSIAEAARAGGGVVPGKGGRLCPVIPGDAVCALDGGAGGVAGLASSGVPA